MPRSKRADIPLKDRVLNGIKINPTNGCWEWQKSRAITNHGHICFNSKLTTAHRASYECFVGPIQKGNVIHHLCENPPCCNPEHLVSLTRKEHFNTHPNGNSAKTHCPRNHPYDSENTYIRKGTQYHRSCRACGRMKKQGRQIFDASHNL